MRQLWLSNERSAAEAAKSRKDRRQAQQLIEVLIDDRTDDLRSAWAALRPRKNLRAGATAALAKIDQSVAERLRDAVSGTR